MTNFEFIDAHVHLYRDIDLERPNVAEPGRRDCDRWGNPKSAPAYMDWQGISKIVCLNMFPADALRKAQLGKIPTGTSGKELEAAKDKIDKDLATRIKRQNEWICGVSKENPRFVAGIGVQKSLSPEEMVEEVVLGIERGAKTVKLIPGLYREFPNDRAFWPMYKKCEELGLAVTSDSGSLGHATHTAHAGGTDIYYGQPKNFVEVLEAFPRLTLVLCHFESAFWDERIEMAKRFPNLHFDVSGGFNAPFFKARDGNRAVAIEDAERVMRKAGIERLMFGSDGPRVMVQPIAEQILGLNLTDDEKRMIVAENAKRIYKL
ncbi:MAG: amidohydrolase [Chloroflexi bacterium]|nr:amidohydrolase [Chloroflexota bacterium]